MAKQKSKNQLRREKAKLKKQLETTTPQVTPEPSSTKDASPAVTLKQEFSPQVPQQSPMKPAPLTQKVLEDEMDTILEQPEFAQFKKVFDRFHMDEPETATPDKGMIMESDGEEAHSTDSESQKPQISKRKLRKQNKIPLAELKAKVKTPELVQWYDVDAMDPLLVVEIKSHKNYIPVPVHWQYKREYLSGPRGTEKKPFELPKFITDTGITGMRDTTKEDESSLKQRQREKVQPKMNRLDMDYQKLHDAFFKFQTKPKMYPFGDLYYEGKENEMELDYDRFKPGTISDELRAALGVPRGISLPWVLKMHQLGPPPSYPDVKYPGFNCPLEQEDAVMMDQELGGDIEREHFGQLLVVESDSESEEEEEEEEDEEEEGGGMPQYVDEDEEQEEQEEQEVQEEDENDGPVVVAEEEEQDEEDVDLPEIVSREPEKEAIEPKKLYEVLKEKFKTGGDGSLSTGSRGYEIPSKRRSEPVSEAPQKRAKTDANADDDDDEEDSTKFKF